MAKTKFTSNSRFIGISPSDTIDHCRYVLEFVAQAMVEGNSEAT